MYEDNGPGWEMQQDNEERRQWDELLEADPGYTDWLEKQAELEDERRFNVLIPEDFV